MTTTKKRGDHIYQHHRMERKKRIKIKYRHKWLITKLGCTDLEHMCKWKIDQVGNTVNGGGGDKGKINRRHNPVNIKGPGDGVEGTVYYLGAWGNKEAQRWKAVQGS